MAKKIKAAGYVRMSTTDQEASPEQQIAEIKKFADRENYNVVKWYRDDGISGDDTEKRLQFKQMIVDATGGEFEGIICWDQDRFGRFDMIEAGKWIHPLREAGIHLATCAQGRIDWNDFAGKLMYSIQQEGKHQYLRDLSRNVTRGMQALADQGKWPGGPAPIGYVIGPDQYLHLGPEEELELVRWIFQTYADGRSMRSICAEMTNKGILSPRRKKWTQTGLGGVLKNRVYLGHLNWDARTLSKYKRKPGEKVLKPMDEWTIVENSHPPIIDPELFTRVQDRLESNKRQTTPSRDGGKFVLSGLLHCGHCGKRMTGGTENKGVSYMCYTNRYCGTTCNRNYVQQGHVLNEILDVLQRKYFNEKNMERLKTEIRRQLEKPNRPSVAVAKHQLADLNQKLNFTRKRLLELDSDMVHIAQDRIRELESQMATLEASIAAAERPPNELLADVDVRVNEALAWYQRLREAADAADAVKVRAFLRDTIDRIDLWFDKIPIGKVRHRYEIAKGRIFIRKLKGVVH